MIISAPWCSLLVIDDCPHLRGDLSCKALLFLSLEVVSFPFYKDVTDQFCFSWKRGFQERET
jgi:hypothetical protein